MAEYLVQNIASVLKEIHPLLGANEFYNNVGGTNKWPKGINPDFYTTIAWHGLYTSKEWNEMDFYKRDYLQKLQDLDRSLTNTCLK
ncbi:hypothetical protein [Algoriphagus mannitolivorans]|uniref:hypothetical protein n=1 Tax=Algoriphagus mannitolivorans TaxID=226504 RepID=UPI00047B4FA2|nr:hypothetical protein [Algoriphagus mannitolivorans]